MRQIWAFVGCFVGGLIIGIVAMVYLPATMESYFPELMGGGDLDGITGTVATKQRKGNDLLLTILTPEGAILATFKKKVTEIDILVDAGDTISLVRKDYRAFLEDPRIGRVRKQVEEPREQGSSAPPSQGPQKDLKEQVLQ